MTVKKIRMKAIHSFSDLTLFPVFYVVLMFTLLRYCFTMLKRKAALYLTAVLRCDLLNTIFTRGKEIHAETDIQWFSFSIRK